jgi:hypothetical protein
MKARLATEIGRRLTFTLTNRVRIEVNKLFPVGMQHEDLPEEFTWDYLKMNYHLDITSCGLHPVYDTPSGKIEPGCLYWAEYFPEDMYWDNMEGPHLLAMLPNGNLWDIDSRASNCTLPNDRLHRCWCRHGEPPNITVDKKGLTCKAGAGSILSGNYHGFLIKGEFKP